MGWLLGQTLAGRQHLELFRTVDGGRHWVALPAPPAPPRWQGQKEPADGVARVTFADSRNGWLYGPGLWATHDGGMTWHRVATHGAQVGSVQASGGRVLAAFSKCGGRCQPVQPRFAVYRSPAGGDDWQRVAGASGQGSGGVVVTGRTGYALGASGPSLAASALVTGPAAGPGRWQRRSLPCGSFLPALIAASAAGLILTCEWPAGAHPVGVLVFRSANGGLTWHRLSRLSLEDGVGSLSITPAGVIIVAGMYNGMLISGDGGRTWHRVASVDNTDAVGGGGVIGVTMFGNRVGAAVVQADRAWLTRDGGRVWFPVTIP